MENGEDRLSIPYLARQSVAAKSPVRLETEEGRRKDQGKRLRCPLSGGSAPAKGSPDRWGAGGGPSDAQVSDGGDQGQQQ
jgi:hypothetical protein